MSYSFKVTADNGHLTVTDDPHVPDGIYVVNGHISQGREMSTLGVTYSTPDGRQRLYGYGAGDLAELPKPVDGPTLEAGEQA